MAFQRAERKRVFLKLAITGPSGSGKTLSALRLAWGLGKKVAVIDTENASAELYADKGTYDVMVLQPPFTVQKYIDGIAEAQRAGYDVLIIDSLTHEWAGDGGLLDRKTAKDARGGNSFANWAEVTKSHERLKSAILQSGMHVICTMRSKMDYAQEEDEKGRKVVRKVGLAPVQREGMEYEFTVVFDVDMQHAAVASKDRTGLFADECGVITEKHGQRFREWLEQAPGQTTPEPPTAQPERSEDEQSQTPPTAKSYTTADAKSLRDAFKARATQMGYEGGVWPLLANLHKKTAEEVADAGMVRKCILIEEAMDAGSAAWVNAIADLSEQSAPAEEAKAAA